MKFGPEVQEEMSFKEMFMEDGRTDALTVGYFLPRKHK